MLILAFNPLIPRYVGTIGVYAVAMSLRSWWTLDKQSSKPWICASLMAITVIAIIELITYLSRN